MKKSTLVVSAHLIFGLLIFTGCSRNQQASSEKMEARLRTLRDKIERREAAKEVALRTEQARKGEGKDLLPFDQPQEAQDFFYAKRTATPDTYLAQLQAAVDQSDRLPVYSTAKGSYVDRFAKAPRKFAEASGTIADALGTWAPLGPGNVGGRTRAILIHPTNPSIMLTAGVAGGVWKSTDGGNTWIPKGDLLVNIAINSMIFDPRDPNIVYAGTGEGYFNGDGVRGLGIFKSTDMGETWTQLASTANSNFYYVQKLAVTRGASQRIYAATRTGIFRSSDAGATWTKVHDGAAVNGCMDLAIQTDRALVYVFASCGTFTQGRIVRALDTGGAQTWTTVHSPANMGRTSLAIAPSNQNIVYAISANSGSNNFLAVYRSTSSGATGSWTTQANSGSTELLNRALLSNPVYFFLGQCGFGTSQDLAQGWYDNAIAVDPVNPNIVWAGGIDLFRSDDGGVNFGQASHWWFTPGVDPEYAHADQHTIVFHPQYDGSSNRTMFVGNDGGLFRTTNSRAPVSYSPNPIGPSSPVCGNTAPGVLSWGNLNNGYQVTQFYHGVVYPDGQTFFGGTQDNGTVRGSIAGGANTWSTIRGGDGGYVAVNPANTNQLWVENTGLSIARSNNGGSSYSSVTSGITESLGNFLFITPFAQDPSNAARMWIGGAFMWRANAATTVPAPNPYWTRASTFFGTRVSAIAVAPSDSNRVYAGTQTGTVFTTTAAGTATASTAWIGTKPRADQNYVSWVTVHPTDPLTAYATVSTFNTGSGTGHVFKTINGGTTWTNVDGSGATGIPDVPVHCLVIDPNNTSRLFVGTDIGVFVSLDGGATWARENTGFANVITEYLEIKNGYLYAFTHGRSAWRVALN